MDEQNNMNQGLDIVDTDPKSNMTSPPMENNMNMNVQGNMNMPNSAGDSTTYNYATFGQRFLALLIDGVIMGIINSASMIGYSTLSGLAREDIYYNPLGGLLSAAYAIILLTKYGATLGKMALGITVVRQETGQFLTPLQAFLRECVGKMLSAIFLLGYLWMLWDKDKQTWHDKIAGSVVIKK